MQPLPPQTHFNEVITGISPLERYLRGVHPRLHLTAAKVDELRAGLGDEPYASMFAALRASADAHVANPPQGRDAKGDLRGISDSIPTLALAFLLTDERRYLDAAKVHLLNSAEWGDAHWHGGLIGGHLLYGHATGFDWLYHHLDPDTLATILRLLQTHGAYWFHEFGTHSKWAVDAYTCNHHAVHVGGFTAASAAIYGEPLDASLEQANGPWLKLAIDRLRTMVAALGRDGMSPEGISYGEYYTEYFVRGLDVAADVLGVDFFRQCEWLRNYGWSQIYASMPAKHASPTSCLIGFGDGVRNHWYGASHILRRLASAYGNGHYQAFAEAGRAAKIGPRSFLEPIWHDRAIEPQPLAQLPQTYVFDDKGVMFSRSGWDGDESVFALRCGPYQGHHAMRNYAHDIGGGHMHPDAGTIQLIVRGDRLIVDDGYTRKFTATQNTLLVNGVGQTGEGADWMEGIELRRAFRSPRILRTQSTPRYDYAIADATEAYDAASRLTKFVRHAIYLKPDCWILVDEVQADAPSRFELAFHSDFAFRGEDRAFIAKGSHASLRVTPLAPAGAVAKTFQRSLIHPSAYKLDPLEALVLSNAAESVDEVFVTVFDASLNGAAPPPKPTIEVTVDGTLLLTIYPAGHVTRLNLRPRQSERTEPIF